MPCTKSGVLKRHPASQSYKFISSTGCLLVHAWACKMYKEAQADAAAAMWHFLYFTFCLCVKRGMAGVLTGFCHDAMQMCRQSDQSSCTNSSWLRTAYLFSSITASTPRDNEVAAVQFENINMYAEILQLGVQQVQH